MVKLSVSQAARQLGISRGDIQNQINLGKLQTHEGYVTTDSIRLAYPSHGLSSEQDRHIQKMQQIKDDAMFKAGADGAITQYFYNVDAYFRFVDEVQKLGVDIPVTPGIMPITNHTQLLRFSNMCGAEIPRWIEKRLMSYGDDLESLSSFGLDVVAKLCDQLKSQGVDSFHFYSMNKTQPSLAIAQSIK